MCQGLGHFSGFLHHFVLAKIVISSIRVDILLQKWAIRHKESDPKIQKNILVAGEKGNVNTVVFSAILWLNHDQPIVNKGEN